MKPSRKLATLTIVGFILTVTIFVRLRLPIIGGTTVIAMIVGTA